MMLTAVVLFGSALLQGAPQKPTWFDNQISGYVLSLETQYGRTCIYDPKANFYVIRSGDCDGASLRLTLTRDRKIVVNEGFAIPGYVTPNGDTGSDPLTVKRLKNLRTGKGVEIGDTIPEVRNRLGKPTKIAKTGSRKQFDELTYHWRHVKNGEGLEWFNTYTFKNGKLIEIAFDREMIPGC